MSINTIYAGIGALALIGGLAACGTAGGSAAPAVAPVVTQTVAPAPAVTVTASPPQVIINNNNNPAPAPAPAQTVYVPAPVDAQADPWSVAVAYTNDINAGDNYDAWNMLSASVQRGWNGNYDTYVANFNPLSFDNVTEVSESGDAVTFTFDLDNHTTGYDEPYTCTFTVDGGIITSSTSYQN